MAGRVEQAVGGGRDVYYCSEEDRRCAKIIEGTGRDHRAERHAQMNKKGQGLPASLTRWESNSAVVCEVHGRRAGDCHSDGGEAARAICSISRFRSRRCAFF